MLTVMIVLALVALALVILSLADRVPLWAAVMLLAVIELLRALPFGR